MIKFRLSKNVLYVLAIIFVASNLRASFVAVGPVIPEIVKDLRLSPTLTGLITSVPLMCFAFGSAFMPKIARKIGLEKILFYSIVILIVGMLIRSFGNTGLLFFGSIWVGLGITIANVLMPVFIKKYFANHIGLVTSIYLTAMNLTSGLAVGFSIQMGKIANLGWKSSIGIWFLLSIVAVFMWLPILKQSKAVHQIETKKSSTKIFKSRLAWQVSIFMGTQSVVFYILAAWLPTILQNWGMEAEKAGWILSYFQLGSVPMMILGPLMANRSKNQQANVWFCFFTLLIGVALLLIFKTKFAVLAALFIGVSIGLAFALATMFFALRTSNIHDSAKLSGMSQSVGYLMAGIFPPLFGGIFELTKSWTLPIYMLFLVAILMLISGLYAAKDRQI